MQHFSHILITLSPDLGQKEVFLKSLSLYLTKTLLLQTNIFWKKSCF